MMIVAVVCFNRSMNLRYWQRAWAKMSTKDCHLVFVITGPAKPPNSSIETVNIINKGMDIGALQRFIQKANAIDYERILWCPDDMLPMRPDVLNYYKQADFVGTFWSSDTGALRIAHNSIVFHRGLRTLLPGDIEVVPHIRSGAFAMTREVANKLQFPPTLLETDNIFEIKRACYNFEFGEYNLYNQVRNMGASIKMADGTTPPNSPMWLNKPHDYFWDSGYGIRPRASGKYLQKLTRWISK